MSEYGKKYDWTRLLNLYTGKIYRNKNMVDELAEFAPGWELAFGEILCQELDEAIQHAGVENSFLVRQIKEKFGGLRISHNQPRNSEIDLICRKFQTISTFVCQRCGRPDVPIVFSPWIRSMCESCYIKTEHVNPEKSDYAALTQDSKSEIPDKMVWEEFDRYDEATNTNHYKKFEVDISDTVRKIRERWEARVMNGSHVVEESKLDKTYTAEELMEELKLREEVDEDT